MNRFPFTAKIGIVIGIVAVVIGLVTLGIVLGKPDCYLLSLTLKICQIKLASKIFKHPSHFVIAMTRDFS